jgi:3,8-divinyl chlorophyllide a/chlorophyllide a reductase subunit Y
MSETIPLTQKEPQGPSCKLHPQSMCPAFGSLRILTRMEGSHPVMATDTGT